LTFNDEPIKLSPKENELLKMLILHENDLAKGSFDKIWRDDNFSHLEYGCYIAKPKKVS
jgi:hypothetical protein